MQKLSSISALFPAYNDGGTIASMVLAALTTLRDLTDDYEVIVVNDGSRDYTAEVLEELAARYPELRVIHHPINRGYGAALRTGFASARKDWLFYTDGDAQYDPHELVGLVSALHEGTADAPHRAPAHRSTEAHERRVDVVNGYKITRHDPISRRVVGRLYHHFVRLLFGFKLRDVDCDFRLIRRAIFDTVNLESDSGAICLEMVKKFQDAGYVFAEVPVHHYHRVYGVSQFWNWRRLVRTARQLLALWLKLVWRKRPSGSAAADKREGFPSAEVPGTVASPLQDGTPE